MNPREVYLESQIKTASPIGLIIMLYDGLINFSSSAAESLKSTDSDSLRKAAESIDRCIKILTELNSSLRHDVSPDFSRRLSNLYAFFLDQFSKARLENNSKAIEDIIPLIENLRDSWKEAENSNAFPAETAIAGNA